MNSVCANCFQDKIARRFVRQNGAVGNCDYCDSKRLKVLQTYKMRDLFEEVIGLYEEYQPAPGSQMGGGETLAVHLQEWEIFSENCEESRQNEILDDIMGVRPRDGTLSASEDWQAKSDHWASTPLHQRWPWFARYLKRSRRFIIEDDPTGEIVRPETWVPSLLDRTDAFVIVDPAKQLYRGRMGTITGKAPNAYRLPLPANAMGAPPATLARASRANPDGISVLYCAFEPETAVIETGRFPGAVVTVRELRPRERLKLADLRGDRSVIEPLGTPNLADVIQIATLIGSLGDALAKPIHPDDFATEYVPTQYLSEVIRSAGYDGMCFGSALKSGGTNVVIFDPPRVRVTRRGWVFELGSAQYAVHPKPEWVKRRKRITRKQIADIDRLIGADILASAASRHL
jgi:hypothetical protein